MFISCFQGETKVNDIVIVKKIISTFYFYKFSPRHDSIAYCIH